MQGSQQARLRGIPAEPYFFVLVPAASVDDGRVT